MAAEFSLAGKESEERVSGSPTLGVCMCSYLESKSNVLAPSTLLGYNNLYKLGYTALKNVPIDEITSDMIQRDINAYSSTHSPKSVRNYNGFLSAVIRQFNPNFSAVVQLPQRKKHIVIIPTQTELEDIYTKNSR